MQQTNNVLTDQGEWQKYWDNIRSSTFPSSDIYFGQQLHITQEKTKTFDTIFVSSCVINDVINCLVLYVLLLMFMGGEAGDLALVLGDCCSQGTPMRWLCWQYFARFYLRQNWRTHLKTHSGEKSNNHVMSFLTIVC